MKTFVLSVSDVRLIVQKVGLNPLMDEMVGRLTTTFRQFDSACSVIPARSGFSYTQPYTGLIEWMPIMKMGGNATIKLVGYHPANPTRHNLPTIVSTVSAYDTRTGHLIGLADATFLTALRTGAASAVASRAMASPDSHIIGLIGAGAQAVSQLHALSRTFPIEQVLVYDADPAVSQSFVTRTAFLNLDVRPVDKAGLDMLVRTADIITTSTSVEIGEGPVFDDDGCKEWLHVNAVGSDFPGKFEVPLKLLKRSFVCPDFPEQAIKEGECQRLNTGEIGPSLVEVIQKPDEYAFVQKTTSVFDSTGWALEDQVAMEMLLDYADDLGVGTAIELESISDDPRNPYEFIARNGSSRPEVSVIDNVGAAD